MRILHCCLANFYIDNYGYQENILPKIHKLQGHEVKIVASTETYINNTRLGYIEPKCYINENGIPVQRLPYTRWLSPKLVHKLRIYKGLKKVLQSFNPDIIFLHDVQFLSIKTIRKYAKANPSVKIFADSHTDFINSAKGFMSREILHKFIYRWCAQLILPFVSKFYGTLPIRNIFLNEVYRIPVEKIELLPLGADDSIYDITNKQIIRKSKRDELGLVDDDIVLITGGKIDKRKNIHLLIESFRRIKDSKIKLIVFGVPSREMDYLINDMSEIRNIKYLGWQTPEDIYPLLFASDLGIFLGTHSVLWEQCCGIGIPCIFKYWENITHINLNGNCILLEDISNDSILKTIESLIRDTDKLKKMKDIAEKEGIKRFSYSSIAKKAIEN